MSFNSRAQMVKAMNQIFIDVYEPTMTELGFSRKNVIFHRLAGKVIQRLSIFRYSDPYVFTIQFDFLPLCGCCEFDTVMCGNRLTC